MTWPSNGARANGTTSHVKLEHMGIGVNAAARIERDHSPCNLAIEKLFAELRHEVNIREKHRRELDFLEKGGDPLEFEFKDVILPSHSTSALLEFVNDSESKRLIHVQSRQSGTEPRKISESVHVVTRDGVGTNTALSRLPKNNGKNSSTPKGQDVSVIEDSADSEVKPAEPEVPESEVVTTNEKNEKADLSSSDVPDFEKSNDHQDTGNLVAEVVEKAKDPKSSEDDPAENIVQIPQKSVPDIEPVKNQPAPRAQVQNEAPARVAMNDDEILKKAEFIKSTRDEVSKVSMRGAPRRKSHWDFVLEEMQWLANDFMQERLWKTAAAAKIAQDIAAEGKNSDTVAAVADEVRPASCGTNPAQNVKAPDTPDCQDRFSKWELFSEERLHFTIPVGAAERHIKSVEESWASAVDLYEREREKQRLDAEEEFIPRKRKHPDEDVRQNKRPRPRPDSDFIVEDDDVFAPIRRRKPPKGPKKVAPSTDSENEWLPDSCSSPEKVPTIKRKRDHLIKPRTDDMSGFKRVKLRVADERMKRNNHLRRADFLHVSINQPGDGVPWAMVEDQTILALEHDFGPNWEFLSDVINTNYHIKGHFRSVKDCKERHRLIQENLQLNRTEQPIIPKGSAMLLLQRLQGPVEEDTLKVHFDKIMKIQKRLVPNLQPEQGPIHQSHHQIKAQILKEQGGRFLSPLDFPIEEASNNSEAKQKDASSSTPAKSGSHSTESDVKPPRPPPKAAPKNVQRSGNGQEQGNMQQETKQPNHQNRVPPESRPQADPKPMNMPSRQGPPGRRPPGPNAGPPQAQQSRPSDHMNFQQFSRFQSPRPVPHWRPGPGQQQTGPGPGYRPQVDTSAGYQHYQNPQGTPRPNPRQMQQVQRQQQQQPQQQQQFMPRSYQSFNGPRPQFRQQQQQQQMYSSSKHQWYMNPPAENRRPIPPVDIIDAAGGGPSSNCK